MKKYIAPSCEEQNLEAANMLATSLDVNGNQTTPDGGWTRGQDWNAENWSSDADDDK